MKSVIREHLRTLSQHMTGDSARTGFGEAYRFLYYHLYRIHPEARAFSNAPSAPVKSDAKDRAPGTRGLPAHPVPAERRTGERLKPDYPHFYMPKKTKPTKNTTGVEPRTPTWPTWPTSTRSTRSATAGAA